jgi:hypothetical protein
MSHYSAEKYLKSYFLDKALVSDVEDYIKDKAKSINQACDEKCEDCFAVEITDACGVERFKSIREYSREIFPNDISDLTMSFLCANGPLQSISITFGKSRFRSKIKLRIQGLNSRETASGIIHELDRILKDNSNLNFIFDRLSIVP